MLGKDFVRSLKNVSEAFQQGMFTKFSRRPFNMNCCTCPMQESYFKILSSSLKSARSMITVSAVVEFIFLFSSLCIVALDF